MNCRTAIIVASISLISSTLALGQDCQDCKTRRVILYDNEVNVARPSTVDSIYRYWDYFFIAGGVRDYASNIDPSRDCIRRLDGAFFTKKDTVSSSIKFGLEHANLPPPGEASEWTNYILYGVVTAQSFTLKLEAGKTRELVKSAVIALPSGFDPFQIGRTVAAFVGPLYTTMMDFERKKRDQGEPYAIEPMVTLIPGKAKLKVNEKTNIDVLFKDCDGAPLKQRHLTFMADGGTLKSADVTTDDQGRGTLEFTAGPVPALANVTTEYLYQLPTGPMSPGRCEPASIQIDKPNDSWFISAWYNIGNVTTANYSGSDAIGTTAATSNNEDWTDIRYSAWVKNAAPPPNLLPDLFLANPNDFVIRYEGSSGERSYSHSHFENRLGFTDQSSNFAARAQSIVCAPELDISVDEESYSLGISNIKASQTGNGTRTRLLGDPITGIHTETDVLTADPETTLSLWVGDATKDTTYTTIEVNSVGSRKTTKTTSVTQKCSWKNKIFNLSYKQVYSEVTETSGLATDISRWDQTHIVRFYLSYIGDPPTDIKERAPTAPAAFTLHQNYPNPFNPSTIISYVLPQRTQATLTITDILGRKIITLVDGEQTAGIHTMKWNAVGLPSGVYFLQMRAGGFVETRKMLLAK